MSGICGIVHLDGAPADRGLLAQLTDCLKSRGPDRQDVWAEGPAGLGHTLLGTTFESENERQPCSLDGRVWITADARIDGWGDLKRKLEAAGRNVHEGVTDAGLILHAYHAWGECCVQHLIGDFAFAIWDGKRQALFCARDHFGVKPFYYAQIRTAFVFSNTLNCVRRYPGVTERLNDQAVADFLLFDTNQDPATTFFQDVQRLPPAHCLTVADGKLVVTRHWTLPAESELLRLRPAEVIERFKELLGTAVADRLRTDRVGVSMSGGLDSASIAAVAQQQLVQSSRPFELRAHTIAYDRLIPDRERHFAGLVAQHLGIPIEFIAGDDYGLYDRWDSPELQRPEPTHEPQLAISSDHLRQCAARSRVMLTGWDGDTVMNEEPWAYFGHLARERRFGKLTADVVRFLWVKKRRIPRSISSRARRILGWKDRDDTAEYPVWINPDFALRMDMTARWKAGMVEPAQRHATHPKGYSWLATTTTWSDLMEGYDPGVTSVLLEARHPLLDTRLISYLLSLPPVPWWVEKHLLRTTLYGKLPEEVLNRLKEPLAGDPYVELLKKMEPKVRNTHCQSVVLSHYVDIAELPRLKGEGSTWKAWTNMRPYSFSSWMQCAIKCVALRRRQD
jgi:asparagine synthase (glutamine-hydrolysing)